jgi:hypothetical protein
MAAAPISWRFVRRAVPETLNGRHSGPKLGGRTLRLCAVSTRLGRSRPGIEEPQAPSPAARTAAHNETRAVSLAGSTLRAIDSTWTASMETAVDGRLADSCPAHHDWLMRGEIDKWVACVKHDLHEGDERLV